VYVSLPNFLYVYFYQILYVCAFTRFFICMPLPNSVYLCLYIILYMCVFIRFLICMPWPSSAYMCLYIILYVCAFTRLLICMPLPYSVYLCLYIILYMCALIRFLIYVSLPTFVFMYLYLILHIARLEEHCHNSKHAHFELCPQDVCLRPYLPTGISLLVYFLKWPREGRSVVLFMRLHRPGQWFFLSPEKLLFFELWQCSSRSAIRVCALSHFCYFRYNYAVCFCNFLRATHSTVWNMNCRIQATLVVF
jgi:hypothetical protein